MKLNSQIRHHVRRQRRELQAFLVPLNELIEPIAANTNGGEAVVRRRVRLGGVLSYYYRDAA